MSISLPIDQLCGGSYLPNTKVYLSRTTGRDFFLALLQCTWICLVHISELRN